MPRFRFGWTNLPESILNALAQGLAISGDVCSELRRIYGARPKEEFIADAWIILQNSWLTTDSAARESIAATLRERGLGQLEVVDNAAYLGTCRNSAGLRRVVLPHFISIGEQPRDSIGTAPIEVEDGSSNPFGGQDRIGGSFPQTEVPNDDSKHGLISEAPRLSEHSNPGDHLREWIGSVLRAVFSMPHLEPDDDGDFAVPSPGSSQLFVSVLEKPLRIEIYSVLLREIEYSEQLMKTLNLVNSRLMFEKIRYLPEHKIAVLSSQIHSDGVSVKSFVTLLKMAGFAADHFDTHLEAQFGGQKSGDDLKSDEQIV